MVCTVCLLRHIRRAPTQQCSFADHISLIVELIGRMPKRLIERGKYAHEIFNNRGDIRRISKLNFWPLPDVLEQKYGYSKQEARAIADFLLPMLRLDPKERATARECGTNRWLST